MSTPDEIEVDGVRLRGGFVIAPPEPRTCNRHVDCDAADARAADLHKAGKRRGPYVDHCHDSCCDECFGK